MNVDNFKLIFGTSENIQALRRKVLDLAIRGKLVVDINDLHKSASTNSTCSYDASKIETENINDDQFEIPLHWSMASSKDVFELVSGRDEPIVDCNDLGIGIPYAMGASNINLNGEFVPERWIEKPKVISKIGDIIITVKGTIGKIYVNSIGDINLSRQTMAIRPKQPEMLDFLTIWVQTIISTLSSRAVGIIPGVSREDILSENIPLPPISEQYQIVARVKFIMSEIDKLETALKKKEQLHDQLPKAVVDAISRCQSEDELKQQLEFLIDNNETIFQTPESMQELRNVILQLAIEGKLVQQELGDEPASELLVKITEEKKRLVNEKKIKNFNELPLVAENEKLFDLPRGWIWTRIGEIGNVKGGKRIPKGMGFSDTVTPHVYLRVTDMKNGTIEDDCIKYIDDDVHQEIKNYTISSDDLYITIAGTIGAVGIIPEKYSGMHLTENASKLCFFNASLVEKSYIQYLLNSDFVQKQFGDKVNQMAQPKLALERILTTVIPLPPISEQHRIVAKVKSLMTLIGQLEEKLTHRNKLVRNLVSAI